MCVCLGFTPLTFIKKSRLMTNTTKSGKRTTKTYPCPICNGTGCRHNDDGTIWCRRGEPANPPIGMVCTGELRGGQGYQFLDTHVVDQIMRAAKELHLLGKKASAKAIADLTGVKSSWAYAVREAYPSEFDQWDEEYYRRRAEEKKHQEQEERPSNNPKRQILSDSERDSQFRLLIDRLSLQERERQHLSHVRGLANYIDYIQFRSWPSNLKVTIDGITADLPGIQEKNGSLYLYGRPGLWIPMYNEKREIIGYQNRPEGAGGEIPKYVYGSSASVGGNGPRLDNDEMPLAFCQPPEVERKNSFALAEGTLKPWIPACYLNQFVIGAPGAAWAYSPQTLRRYVQQIADYFKIDIADLVCDLQPDAGMLSNRQIMNNYWQVIRLLAQWQVKTRIAWWGQFNKEALDLDELLLQNRGYHLTYISVEEWQRFWLEDIRDYLLHSDSRYDMKDWTTLQQHPDKSELGFWVPDKKAPKDELGNRPLKWIPKANFSVKILRELVGVNGSPGGLVLRVKRSFDPLSMQDELVVLSEFQEQATAFLKILKTTGKNYYCNDLKPKQLQSYLNHELAAYYQRGGQTYKLADRVGCQNDGTFVFPDCQINSSGQLIREEESLWVFHEQIFNQEKIPVPNICTQLEPKQAFRNLVVAARDFFGPARFMQTFFTMAFVTAGLFFDRILEQEGNFPILSLYGDAGSGKSMAGEVAHSLIGFDQRARLQQKTSESALYERLKRSGGLTQFIDDPPVQQKQWVEQLIKVHYNASSRVVRENTQEPHCGLMIAANFSIGDNDPIILSRQIRQSFPSGRESGCNTSAYRQLKQARRVASAALPMLIQIGYPQEEVAFLETQLVEHLSKAHSRLALSYALIGTYAFKLAELSDGVVSADEVWEYLLSLCAEANQEESNQSSFEDFIDKLLVLRSETKVGPWNCRLITTDGNQNSRNYKCLAVYLKDVWKIAQEHFKNDLPYSQRIIRNQIEAAGGVTYSKQKFHSDKDSSIAYSRLLLSPRLDADGNPLPPSPPPWVSRSCVEIPIQLLFDRIQAFEEFPPPDDEPPSSPPPDGGNDGGGGYHGGDGHGGLTPDSGAELNLVTNPTPIVTKELLNNSNQRNAIYSKVSAHDNPSVTTVTTFSQRKIENFSVSLSDELNPKNWESEQNDKLKEKNKTDSDLEIVTSNQKPLTQSPQGFYRLLSNSNQSSNQNSNQGDSQDNKLETQSRSESSSLLSQNPSPEKNSNQNSNRNSNQHSNWDNQPLPRLETESSLLPTYKYSAEKNSNQNSLTKQTQTEANSQLSINTETNAQSISDKQPKKKLGKRTQPLLQLLNFHVGETVRYCGPNGSLSVTCRGKDLKIIELRVNNSEEREARVKAPSWANNITYWVSLKHLQKSR